MMDEIFEMIMKEARSRPGPDILLNADNVILELRIRVIKACNVELEAFLASRSKDDKPA